MTESDSRGTFTEIEEKGRCKGAIYYRFLLVKVSRHHILSAVFVAGKSTCLKRGSLHAPFAGASLVSSSL